MTTIQDHIANGLGFVAVVAALALFAAVFGALSDLILRQDLREKMGLTAMPPSLFAAAAALYVLIAFTLVVGLFLLILATIGVPITERGNSPKELADAFLFFVLRIAGLTTVLGAVIALPFTLIRLKLTRQQTTTNEESLFNEKINAATELLYARRQYTVLDENGLPKKDGWEDDITRRNAAIDRLERLAGERPDFAPDIARMLSVYVRELTTENPPETPPDGATLYDLRDWAQKLKRKRTDMENAVQTLGRMISDYDLRDHQIDLRSANLQAFDLQDLCFDQARLQGAQLQGVDLRGAQLRGANLSGAALQRADLRRAQLQEASLSGARLQASLLWWAQLQGANLESARLHGAGLLLAELQRAELRWANLQGASLMNVRLDDSTGLGTADLKGAGLRGTDCTNQPQLNDHLDDFFADASVTPHGGARPSDEGWPEHWAREELNIIEFNKAWLTWQRSIGFDPDDPATWDKPKP